MTDTREAVARAIHAEAWPFEVWGEVAVNAELCRACADAAIAAYESAQSGWQDIHTLELAWVSDDTLNGETILLWNPCDGLHVEWLAHRFPSQLVADGFTHWRRPPPPPEDKP